MSTSLSPWTGSPEQLKARGQQAGKVRQSHEYQAKRLVRDWPVLSEAQKAQIRTLLAPVCGGGNG